MRSILKYIFFFLFLAAGIVSISSCTDDDPVINQGKPIVHYIRSTDPTLSDSLLVGSFMGSLVAVVGDNLETTREMWFNDQRATLNPNYVTPTTILVSVPSTVPTAVTDKIRFVFADGTEMLYDFKVNVPAPVLNSIKCEYVPDGDVAVLRGDFFFVPTQVIFPGDLEGEIVSLTKTEIQVKVPEGSSTGKITIKTNFGTVKSAFLFRDDRNIILDYDTKLHETWTAPIGAGPEPPEVSGEYAYFKHVNDAAWMWTNELTMQYWATRGRGNVPVATGNINDLVFKFEVNVPEPWKAVRMEIFFGPYADDHGRDVPSTVFARWKPWKDGPYVTDGWETISIPLTEFKYGKDDDDASEIGTRQIENLSSLTNLVMMMFGPGSSDGSPNPVYIAFDNLRIVPKS
ncbi:MAG TPA: glycan-binding surface protein [Saprospiraceae bacterium]|nr:glycan-binding surface protein [Saprospiraceae bacterium]